jgi:predicted AlkP superfamily pyrophosphatase or phosphodiesterase
MKRRFQRSLGKYDDSTIKSMIMSKRYFTLPLLFFTMLGLAQPGRQTGADVPKLVIGITIEHLRPETIERYWESYPGGGFKRLFDQGARFYQARADLHNVKPSTLVPTIYTGTYPSVHGMVGDKWYNQLTQKDINAVTDNYFLTLGSDSEEGNCSAKQLKVYTLGDVMKQQSNQRSKVYSVALNATAAVMSAGHSANGAFWYDKTNGHLITSSYYMSQFPDWVFEFNAKKMPETYLERNWDLMLPLTSYKAGTVDADVMEDGFWKKWNTFPYSLKKIAATQEYPMELLKATPWGNKLINDFAIQLMMQEELGQDDSPDLLMLTYSMLDYANKWYHPSSVEVQEMCLRINQEITNLLNALDKIMGKDQYVVFLTAASTMDYSAKIQKEEFNFNAGEFSPQSAMALLRSYLNALYGVGEWLLMYNEEQVYLNHQLLEKKSINLNQMRESVAGFLNQFSGVRAAVPAHIIESGNLNNPRFEVLENSYSVQRSGDVLLLLEEGWMPVFRYHQPDYSTTHRVPLVFYGQSVTPGEYYIETDVIDVVPSICRLLKIFPPDDARGKILEPLFR